MTSSPVVSVLLPVYNAERYLPQAVQSILEQTLAEFEFLIINDGSTDGSLAILERFARSDPRIRLISRPNTGYVVALNEMLALARGEFVARMDADDVAAPQRFGAQVAWLRQNPLCVAVGSRTLWIDAEGDPLCEANNLLTHAEIDGLHMTGQGGGIAHPAAVIRRSAMEAIGAYRPELEPTEDLDLFLRLAEVGELANVPQVLLYYRHHLASVSHTRYARGCQTASRALREACQRRGLPVPAGVDSGAEAVTPPSAVPNLLDIRRKWAWWALAGGHRRTARKHAIAAFRLRPLAVDSWRLLYCSMFR